MRSIRQDRRGTVAVLTAIALPAALGVMALDINTSQWELTRVRLQRIADTAAMAGAARYAETWNGPAAATTAANVAELNGVPAGARTGTGTDTVTDDYGTWSTSFAVNTTPSGSFAGTVTVQVQSSAPVWFAGLFGSGTTQMLSATAVAGVKINAAGGQACLLALKGYSNSITTFDDISISGNTSITSSTCGVRSDGSLTVSGNATIAVPAVIASGTIGRSGSAQIDCPGASPCAQAGMAQIPDPFYSTYYSALSLPPGVYNPQPSGTALNPGQYSSLSFNGNKSFTLSAGIYYVQGAITINGSSSVTGSGVTLISGDGITMNGNGNVSLSAPSSGPTAGLLYGTSSSSASVGLSGNSNDVLTGAVYAPNAQVTITGDSNAYTTKSTCLDVVASTASFTGNSDFTDAGCAGLGVPAIYNTPPTAMLIQ